MNLQDAFLNQVRIQKVPVTIYLSGGHPMRGTIKGFDQFCVLVAVEDRYNLVYKHAISSIAPVRAVNIFRGEDNARKEENGEANDNDETV